MRSILLAASLALLSTTAMAQTAGPTYTSVWDLGDSLSDTGRTYARTKYLSGLKDGAGNAWEQVKSLFGGSANLSQDSITQPVGNLYYQGRFSNGRVWVEYLNSMNGLTYNADHNLAWGGAVTGTATDSKIYLVIQHLEQQVGQFTDKVKGTEKCFIFCVGDKALSTSEYGDHPLVTLWIGGNNFRQVIEDTSFNDSLRTFISSNTTSIRTYLNKKGDDTAFTDFLNTMYTGTTLGGKLLVEKTDIVKNVPDDLRKINSAIAGRNDIASQGVTYYVPTIADVSTTPKMLLQEADTRFVLSSAVKDTNRSLKEALYDLSDEFSKANSKTRLVIVDTAALLDEVTADPQAFGFVYSNKNCVDSETGKYTNGCSADNVGDYLYWDQFHPTTKAHEMVAVYAQTTDWLEYGATVDLTQPYVANIEIRNQTFSGVINGTGSMIKKGEAELTLAGLNSYSGGTRIDNGTIRITTDENLGAHSGVLTMQGGGIATGVTMAMTRNVVVNKSVSIDSPYGGSNFGGTFTVDSGAVLTLRDNTISGTGDILKNGAGTLDIRSAVTDARTLTQVDSGLLKINAAGNYVTQQLVVNSGASLGGSGTIVGTVVNNGQLVPGNSIGTLTIVGDLIQGDSGVYGLEVDTARSDNLVVTGNIVLDGTVNIITDPTDKLDGQTFTIARAEGSVSGEYDEVTDLSPFLFETLHYDPNSISVSFTRDFTAPATTANEAAVGAYLNGIYLPIDQGDLDNVFYALDNTVTAAAGAKALQLLSGETLGNGMTADALQRGQFTRALEDRIAGRRFGIGQNAVTAATTVQATGGAASGLAGAVQAADAPDSRSAFTGVSTWARVLGGPAFVRGTGAFDMTSVGVLVGVDKSFGDSLIGMSLAYGNFNADGNDGSSTSADTYGVSLYGSLQNGQWFADGTLSYNYADYSTERQITFGTLSRTAIGSPSGNDLSASVKAGAHLSFSQIMVEPSLGFDWYRIDRGSFSESSAGSAGLSVRSQTMDLYMPSVGARLATRFEAGAFTITPEIAARYYYNFGDTDAKTQASLIGAPAGSFEVESAGIGRNIGVLSAGIAAETAQNLRLTGQYELAVSGSSTAHTFSAGFKYTW